MSQPDKASAAHRPQYEAQQVVKVRRGDPLPEGWYHVRHVYETTDVLGTWDVMVVGQMREVEDGD